LQGLTELTYLHFRYCHEAFPPDSTKHRMVLSGLCRLEYLKVSECPSRPVDGAPHGSRLLVLLDPLPTSLQKIRLSIVGKARDIKCEVVRLNAYFTSIVDSHTRLRDVCFCVTLRRAGVPVLIEFYLKRNGVHMSYPWCV
jgi:hypothetical protein